MKNKQKIKQTDDYLILDRLRFENPWWITGDTEKDYRELKHRPYFELFYPLVREVEVKRAVVLMGPRRVGKTVMLHHTIQYLLEEKIERNQICFINIENPIYNNISLDQLFRLARQAAAADTSD